MRKHVNTINIKKKFVTWLELVSKLRLGYDVINPEDVKYDKQNYFIQNCPTPRLVGTLQKFYL